MKYGLIIKLIIIISISLFKKGICSYNLIYPTSLTLLDGNFFIVEQRGIYIFNSAFQNIERSYNLSRGDQIRNLSDLSNTNIKYNKKNFKPFYLIIKKIIFSGLLQYVKPNWKILCLIKSKIYLFSQNGILLNQANKIIDEDNISHITLIPILEDTNYNIYFIISFFTQSNELKLILYTMKSSS